MTTSVHHTPRHTERGAALALAIVIVVVVGLLTVAVSMSLVGSADRSAQRAARVQVQPALDAAQQAYVRGLNTGRVTERTRYAMTQAVAAQIVPPTSTVVRTSTSAAVHTDYRVIDSVHEHTPLQPQQVQLHAFRNTASPVTNERFTVITPTSGGRALFWQIYRVDMSSATAGTPLAVYFRAWEGAVDGSTAGRARIVRMELSVGRFSDYQTLVNSTIVFGTGSTINGPVHSNGTSETPGVDPDPYSIDREGAVTCTGGVGGAPITVGQGTINLPGCNILNNTGNFIDFGRVSTTFTRLTNECTVEGTDAVRCFTGQPSYEVVLYQNSIRVLPFGTTYTVPNDGRAAAYLFDSDVRVRMASDATRVEGRITIAAQRAGARAANITVEPNLVPRDRDRDVIGLVAEGHVVIDIVDTTCAAVDTVDAAVIASTGGMRINSELLSIPEVPFAPNCNRLDFTGSLSSHYAPVLRWHWGSGATAGYATRNYTWNTRLVDNPPPYFPLSRAWEGETVKDANDDCLTGAGLRTWSCR